LVVCELADLAVAEDFGQVVPDGVQAGEPEQVAGGLVTAWFDLERAAIDGDRNGAVAQCVVSHDH
jgi:hypothetical protein